MTSKTSEAHITYDDVHPTLREFLGCREALRRLGFTPDELYCQVGQDLARARPGAPPELSCFLELRSGGRTFRIGAGTVGDARSFLRSYQEVAEAINEGRIPEADLRRMHERCQARLHAEELLAALRAKGIQIPKMLS
jgi:hypothetical protein